MTSTRDQKRARIAYGHVETVAAALKGDYGRTAHRLPVLVRQAGLAQALAFVAAKNKEGSLDLIDNIAAMLNQLGILNTGEGETLMERARQADLNEYLLLTQEVQQALFWYKRYAQSVLGVDASDDGED